MADPVVDLERCLEEVEREDEMSEGTQAQPLPEGVTPELSAFILQAVAEAQSRPTTFTPSPQTHKETDDDASSLFDTLLGNTEATPTAVNSMLDDVAQEFLPEDSGPSLQQKIADIISKMLSGTLSETKLQEKCNKYLKPQNCERLQPTRVNQLVWDKLRSTTRNMDLKFQKVQLPLMKGFVALAYFSEYFLQIPNVDKGRLHELFDAMSLLAQANSQLNLARRELIKTDLSKAFKHLCSAAVPITTQLFGDDVSKHVKEIAETRKMGFKIANRGTFTRSRPYGQSSGRGRGRGHFLSRGKTWAQGYPQPEKERFSSGKIANNSARK
ncbi:hypothetical protein HOLleu_12329 [Holothuria leucospilota]|uniref:Uncharacterized protein n=1 Tax=Holothuria leucospilota TaxID=206669 RepID=A0A9Q1CB45_HOLLE|nr:hypothetical protein HOLleu_12329 [Holothuria leucospilota]